MGLSHFMRETKIRNSALRVAKAIVDVDRKRSKRKDAAHSVTSAVPEGSLNQFLE